MKKAQTDRNSEIVKRRYNRLAPLYNVMVGRASGRWWELLWSKVEGSRILEVGVGTGKSFSFYPTDAEITAIDFSVKMLAYARARAKRQNVKANLLEMDVQALEFEDDTFDTVAASLVFCSVPDAVRGLKEVHRVCKPGGKVVLLEHVLSETRALAQVMNALNPLFFWAAGDNINRRTVEDVEKSGLVVEKVTDLKPRIFKLIEARKR